MRSPDPRSPCAQLDRARRWGTPMHRLQTQLQRQAAASAPPEDRAQGRAAAVTGEDCHAAGASGTGDAPRRFPSRLRHGSGSRL